MKNKLIKIILISLAIFLIMPVMVFAEESPPELSIPRTIQESGTFFEITDSEYINVSLESTEEITVLLESIPKIISLQIEASSIANSTQLILKDLEPNTTYYKFEDSYKNKNVFISDNNGKYTWTQDLTSGHHIWFQPNNGTVYLPEDCSTIGTWNETTKTCVLIQDLTESVEITSNDIVLDCNNHNLTGVGHGLGIYLNGKEGVTVKNCQISNFTYGFYFWNSSKNEITNNFISKTWTDGISLNSSNYNILKDNISSNAITDYGGIFLHDSHYNNLIRNTASENKRFGFSIYYSSNNTLTDNKMINNGYNFYLYGKLDEHFNNNIDITNTINGKPIYFIQNAIDQTYDISTNAGAFYCINCRNVTIKDLTITDTAHGVFLWKTNESTIENITSSNIGYGGIDLYYSDYNTIVGNTGQNNGYGIAGLHASSDYNSIYNNTSQNSWAGIYLWDSSNNNIYHNNLIDNDRQISNNYGSGNNFDNGYLSGGNYFNDYTGIDIYSGPNQDQLESDGIGDAPHTFHGGQDRYPFMEESGWEALPNQAPIFSNFNQYKSDETTIIDEEQTTTESIVVFKAIVNDLDNDQVRLQVEIKEYEQSFDELNIIESDLVDSGNEAVVTSLGLVNGQYKWRARAMDENEAISGDWQEFGEAGNVDFIVDLPLSYRAANLAKELVNSAYLYGGKGWDYNQSEFVAPITIKTGYNFWNEKLKSIAFGLGMDCSGLIMWSYNRSFDPLKSRFNNFVKAEGANEQYRYNTMSTTESQLKPGDVMFFDFNDDNVIDHVTMYVGESGGYDVVNAADPDMGIVGRFKDDLKQPYTGFIAFKRVVQTPPPAILVTVHSPVDLIVTDPDGFTITSTTTISSDTEYLREIPGVLYYSEIEKGIDGNPIDQVYSYTQKTGDYWIDVVPEPDASPTDTYSLEMETLINGEVITTVLAEDVLISEIPEQGYGIILTETEIKIATPKLLKTNTIPKLETAKTNYKIIDKQIDLIIKRIKKSLKNNLWIDDSHLDSKHGKKVFHEEYRAVVHLNFKVRLFEKLIPRLEKIIEKKRKRGFKEGARLNAMKIALPIFKEVISDLVRADEILAEVALQDAKNTPVENPKFQRIVDRYIGKAEREITKARQELERNRPARAIKRFEKSWKYSQLAIKFAGF